MSKAVPGREPGRDPNQDRLTNRILRATDTPNLLAVLTEQLTPTDLQEYQVGDGGFTTYGGQLRQMCHFDKDRCQKSPSCGRLG